MDWKNVISTVAPWIGTALGGPLGGMAVSAIADALNLDDKTESAIKTALSGASPEQLLALKNADQEFALRMQEIGFKNEQALAALAVDNTKDARDLQKVTRSWVPSALSIIITLGFLGILVGMMSGELTSSDNQALLIMLGALGAAFGAVINYWLGSTMGSSRKTELIAQAPAK